ncbi:hypothetical protein B0H17DRAFT_1273986 [Mycena rosella]|uniref:Non-specific serine/threonine protein kinase n=1 Tax=Mycena rosella TaxID=1033263 RepID=A0AAD7GZ44_MYCRO|nr:hypothetical protein B0H17DRAFT_1273986 [Mycena rosella]
MMDGVLLVYHLLALCGVHHLDIAEKNIILKPKPLSPRPFCDDLNCQLRFTVPAKSLVQEFDIPGQPAFNYRTLTLAQIESLPIVVINFGHISLLEEIVPEMQDISHGKYIQELLAQNSRPERVRKSLHDVRISNLMTLGAKARAPERQVPWQEVPTHVNSEFFEDTKHVLKE